MHVILYSGKVWQVARKFNLAYLVNPQRFTKLKPSKLVVTINNPLADLFICQIFSARHLKRINSSNILPVKLSCYTAMHCDCGILNFIINC